MKIGFIGLGRMGHHVAANLLKAGHSVTVWNRSQEPVQALVAKGAQAARTPEDALKGDAVFSMLSVFDKIGARTVPLDAPEKANLFKIAGNFMIASELESTGEAFALLRKGGVDPTLFHDVLSGRLFTGAVFKNYGTMILNRAYEPAGFALTLGLKDVNLAR